MARILRMKESKSTDRAKNRWDDWVPQDRFRKLTPENRELAAQLHNQMKKTLQDQKAPKSTGKGAKGVRTNGSDYGSRGSEERGSAAVQGGRGNRRGPRDYDLEHVSFSFPFYVWRCFVWLGWLVMRSGCFLVMAKTCY
jgi:hypothetical protein